ncbi:histidine kinase [Blautia sp. RD014234]|nr:histidine kinase [Blautia parvula]
MLSQVNLHYLYNVLNTVVYLAAAEKISESLKSSTH